MRLCSSLSDIRAREIDGVKALGIFVGFDGVVKLLFLQYMNIEKLQKVATNFMKASIKAK